MFFAIVLPGIVSLWGGHLALRHVPVRFTATIKAEQVSRLPAAKELRHLPAAAPAIERSCMPPGIGIHQAPKASMAL
jgi:hypothetical protein